jgi:putative ABC transport system substrate-binding protein
VKRRTFIAALGGAAAWPLVARGQQPSMPVVGFLRSTPAGPFAHIVGAFRQGLNETGFVEGQNVAIEQRWADNQLDQLPALAAELVRRQAAVIVCNAPAVEAARNTAATIPVVFVIGGDPVAQGLVTSLNRPGGNLTGLTFFGNRLGAKRLEMLHELVPRTSVIAALIDPNFPEAALELREVEEAGRTIGQKIVPVNAKSEHEFDAAFTSIVQAGAGGLVVIGSPLFTSKSRTLVALSARHAIPVIYDQRDYVAAGGLISYSTSFTDAYRQAGVCGTDSQGRQTVGVAGAAADQVRARHQPQDRQGARPYGAADAARPRRRGDRMRRSPKHRYDAPVVKRSVKIPGHKTSVSLEEPFWDALKNIAALKNVSVSDLVSRINKKRSLSNVSSAVRLFVLAHYRG